MTDPAYPDALPAQSRLHWYVVERVLGQGGFGITYLARDTNLDRPVAIKEYLPVDAATRMPDATIRARTDELRDRYRWGLERFIQEARTLARFDHQNIVHVHSVFEFNNTAYMVMRFESGVTLSALLDRRGTLLEDELLRIILPVLDGLELVHNAGFIHRDIKPDNIHIGADGTPVLLDFGSARQSLGAAHTLTILVAPGYAPFEQYYSDSGSQGPWTDIYGLGATCYRAIAGRSPLDAVSRSKGVLGSTQDVMVPATIIGAGRYSGRVLAAIDHALAFAEKDRPQSLAEWRGELVGVPAAPAASPRVELPVTPSFRPVGASVNGAADSPTARITTFDRAAVTERAATPLASQSAERHGSPDMRGRAKWIMAAVVVAGIGAAGVYVFHLKGEARQLQAQVKERDQAAEKRAEAQRAEGLRAAADADRVAKEKSDAEARQRQEQEQEARIAQEKSRADAARKREMDMKAKPVEQAQRTATAATRAADRQGQGVSTAPVVAPMPVSAPSSQPAPMPVATSAAEPTLPKTAPAAAEAAEKPAPITVAGQLAAADRATSAGRFADAIAALKPIADAGNAQAQLRLGDMYAEGRGTARDAAAAQTWYEKAAMGGDTAAQMKLGAIYAGATGTTRNNNIAYIWFGTAARLGLTAAQAERDRIGALLQPAERAQADKVIESKVAHMREKT